MKSIYQGEIDIFCAPYAVLNALRHMYGTRLLSCRLLLHETLRHEAKDSKNWENVLNQTTDYCDLVDAMLERVCTHMPLRVTKPFMDTAQPDVSTVWSCMETFLSASQHNHVVVFQFIRYLAEERSTDIKHWTCACVMDKDGITLFDSSRNEGALTYIPRAQLIAAHETAQLGKVCIMPHTMRCLQRALL